MGIIQGAAISLLSYRWKWSASVFLYRCSTLVSFLVVLFCLVGTLLIVSAPNADPFGRPIGQEIVEFGNNNRAVIGQIVIAFFVTICIVLIELLVIQEFQDNHSRPIMIWMLWFGLSFFFSTWLSAFGQTVFEDYLCQMRRPPSAITAASDPDPHPPATTTSATTTAATGPTTDHDATTFPAAGLAGAGTTVTPQAPVGASKWFAFGLLTMTGLLYYGWTTGILYRRINDIDRFVGKPAARLGFVPCWPFGNVYHPAQAVIVGPAQSGKSEMIRGIDGIAPRRAGQPESTHQPILSTLRSVGDERLHDVSLIDTGGEMMGDQFDLIRKVRTDCLVVVLCASHLARNAPQLRDVGQWTLENVHNLVNLTYTTPGGFRIGTKAAAFFQTLFYATNRAGARPARNQVAAVHTVLVVMKDRDSAVNTGSQFSDVPLAGLEALAQDIYRRFNPAGDGTLNAAAIKLLMHGPNPNRLTLEVKEQSSILQDANHLFMGCAYAMSGTWGTP